MRKHQIFTAASEPQPYPVFTTIEQLVVLVHMQSFFRIGNCLQSAEQQVIAAVANDVPVFLLETVPTFCDDSIFLGPGSITVPEILRHLKGYEDWHYCLSSDHEVAFAVKKWMDRRFEVPKVIRIFGVETDNCVLANIKALLVFFPDTRIEVVAEACAANTPDPWANTRTCYRGWCGSEIWPDRAIVCIRKDARLSVFVSQILVDIVSLRDRF